MRASRRPKHWSQERASRVGSQRRPQRVRMARKEETSTEAKPSSRMKWMSHPNARANSPRMSSTIERIKSTAISITAPSMDSMANLSTCPSPRLVSSSMIPPDTRNFSRVYLKSTLLELLTEPCISHLAQGLWILQLAMCCNSAPRATFINLFCQLYHAMTANKRSHTAQQQASSIT